MSGGPEGGPIRVAVVGVGHHGRHHARNYAEMEGAELVAVVDRQVDHAAEVAGKYGCRAVSSVDEIIDEVDAASIVVPTVHHLETARVFIERRKPVLIEKPVAATVAEAEELLALSRRHDCLVAVGHIERFNPVVQAMRRFDVAPRFIECHRISPFTFRSADVGVVLDMMIHDIDIVLSLVRDEPAKIDAVGVGVLSKSEDICSARVTFKRGCVANLTASRLALKTERKIRVFSDTAYLSLDYQQKVGLAVRKKANLDILELARKWHVDDLSQMAGVDFTKLVHVEPLQPADESEPLRAELESFLTSIRQGRPPEVGIEDGVAALRLASDIVTAAQQHAWDDDPAGRIGPRTNLLNTD
ncbi:MAG: Gfo/Idh/MocA family oxidoreductase [Phycisphaerae bacterium]|nr:Gfo/Idh/MocA family oxidoreductase [Phycisphaerae bacterium]